MAARASVVHPRKAAPPRQKAYLGGTALLGLLVVVEVLAGQWVVAAIIAAATVLLLSGPVLSARRSATRQPDWIEVRPDRIVAMRSVGTGWELVRRPDSVLRVHDFGGQPLLSLDALGADDTIPLDRFDVDEVRRAAVAKGWSFIAGDSVPIETAVPNRVDETRVQLREGSTQLPQLMAKLSPGLLVALAVCVAVGAVAAGIARVSPTVTVISLFGVSFVLGLAIAAIALVSVRRTSLVIVVTPERVTLTHGTLTSQVVQRSAVASATVGSRWARLRDPKGKALLWLPLRPRRDDVINALTRNGWPTSESPGGFRRHL